MNEMEPLEVEVKFYIPDISPIRNRILELGAVSTGQVFESNIRFEDENKTLMKKKFLLRLRKDSKTTLTFKSPLLLKTLSLKYIGSWKLK